MRTIPFAFVVLTMLGIGTLTLSARAQMGRLPSDPYVPPISGTPVASGSFVMPEDRDPERLTFTQTGFIYTHADSSITSPGDNSGAILTGGVLVMNGLNLLGDINSGSDPIVEVYIFTDYAGPLSFDSQVGFDPMNNTTRFPFNPWNAQRLLILPAGFTQGFLFYKNSSSQADLNITEYQALVRAELGDTTSDPTNFSGSHFGFEGFTSLQPVPEPGMFALFTGFSISGGLLWRRRQRRSCP